MVSTLDAGPALSVAQLNALLAEHFAHCPGFRVTDYQDGRLRMHAESAALYTRPGGTVAGPELVRLMDLAAFALVAARLGPVLSAVTTELSVQYLDLPDPAGLTAVVEFAMLGRRSAVILAEVHDSRPALVATATLSWALPARLSRTAGPQVASSGVAAVVAAAGLAAVAASGADNGPEGAGDATA